MLFIVVGALEVTGVTRVVARQLMRGTGGRPAALVLAVGWSTGLLSALLANMLAIAAFLPVVADLNAQGAHCPASVYWLMLFGATFMGNMTSIGSTCNIIACGMADKRGHGTIYFGSWLKIGIIINHQPELHASGNAPPGGADRMADERVTTDRALIGHRCNASRSGRCRMQCPKNSLTAAHRCRRRLRVVFRSAERKSSVARFS
jgi:hypothetical protein